MCGGQVEWGAGGSRRIAEDSPRVGADLGGDRRVLAERAAEAEANDARKGLLQETKSSLRESSSSSPSSSTPSVHVFSHVNSPFAVVVISTPSPYSHVNHLAKSEA